MKQIILPSKLKKGDCVGIVSPSKPITDRQKFAQGVENLEKLGFKVKLGQNVYAYNMYMAGSIEERVADIHNFFIDEEVKAIFCSTGGTTANQLLNSLDFELIRENPKIFMGFSDIDTLTNAIYSRTKLVTYSGPTVNHGFKELTETTEKSFRNCLMKVSKENLLEFASVEVLNEGHAEGCLVGGHLEAVLGLIRTSFSPSFEDAIWFWEIYDKTPREIDWLLTQYELLGVFNSVKAIIIGNIPNCEDRIPQINRPIVDILFSKAKSEQVPIIKVKEIGHYTEDILTLPIGAKTRLDTHKGSLELI